MHVEYLAHYLAGGSAGKESTCNVGDLGSIPGSGRSLEKGIATHSSMSTGDSVRLLIDSGPTPEARWEEPRMGGCVNE